MGKPGLWAKLKDMAIAIKIFSAGDHGGRPEASIEVVVRIVVEPSRVLHIRTCLGCIIYVFELSSSSS
jgi:hypothetical protein